MGLGPWEVGMILVVAILVFGGSRLAGVGKGVGRSIREFKEEIKGPEAAKKPDTLDAETVQPETDKRDSQ